MVSLSSSAPGVRPIAWNPTLTIQAGAALAAFAAILFAPQLLNDGDTFWHLASGRWMLDHREVLRRDVFSSTWAGRPWVSFEWLSDVLIALAWRTGGWAGVHLLFAAAGGAGAAILARGAGRHLGGASLVVALVLAFGCVAPNLLARPHLLALPLLALWTERLLAARDAGRAPPLWLAAVMAVWANLHGSYVLGFPIYGAFALEAWLAGERRWAVARAWAVPGLLALAATMATPHGFGALSYPFYILGQQTLTDIAEWRAADFTRLQPFELALLTTVGLGLWRGVKVPPVRLALLIALLHMALQHQRHQPVLAVVGMLVLAGPFADALGRRSAAHAGRGVGVVATLAVAALLAVLRFAAPPVIGDTPNRPVSALAHVPAALRQRPMLNSYGFGGYLIAEGVRPFIDGRADMYGDAFFRRFLAIVGGDTAAARAAFADHQVDWTLLSPADPLARAMDAEPGWTRLYADRTAVLHARIVALGGR